MTTKDPSSLFSSELLSSQPTHQSYDIGEDSVLVEAPVFDALKFLEESGCTLTVCDDEDFNWFALVSPGGQ